MRSKQTNNPSYNKPSRALSEKFQMVVTTLWVCDIFSFPMRKRTPSIHLELALKSSKKAFKQQRAREVDLFELWFILVYLAAIENYENLHILKDWWTSLFSHFTPTLWLFITLSDNKGIKIPSRQLNYVIIACAHIPAQYIQ